MKTFNIGRRGLGAVPSALKMFLRTLSDGWKPSAIRRYASSSAFSTIFVVACLLLTGCYSESYDAEETSALNGKTQVVLTFVTPNTSSTRSATEDPDGYEAGVGYEDYVNISGHDYKIYFFSYSNGDEKGGKYIAEFEPTEIKTIEASSYTSYMVTGEVPTTLLEETSFRVVMLANWGGWYPSVTEGTTTIDDLCEGDNTTFNAFKKFAIDQDNLIPFYGVQEYSGITFSPNTTTTLTTPVSLLRAVAKVEVIFEPYENSTTGTSITGLDDVSIVNYNSQGYCAPKDVYVAADYDTNASKNPDTTDWPDEWVTNLHLVNGTNDTDSKSQDFIHVNGYTSTTNDTWRIYLPEYNNLSTDYSYIEVNLEGAAYQLYFAEYTNGTTDISNISDRYNIKRNNIYRFYVSLEGGLFRVRVNQWENVYDNEFDFTREPVI